MTKDEKLIEKKVKEIKVELCKYIDAKNSPDTDTQSLETDFNKRFYGNEPGNPSMDCLIANSIQTRPEKKSVIDKKRLEKGENHKFKIVNLFLSVTEDIEHYAKNKRFPENSFLNSQLEALKAHAKSYTEKMKEVYKNKEASPNNTLSQSVSAMPENNGLSAANPQTLPRQDNSKHRCECEPFVKVCPH